MEDAIFAGRQYKYGAGVRIVDDIRWTHFGRSVLWRKKLKDGTWGYQQYTMLETFRRNATLIPEEANHEG